MKNEIEKREGNLFTAMNSFIENTGMQNVQTRMNTRTGTASISGERDGYRYTTTVQRENNGQIQTNTVFQSGLTKGALVEQIKSLISQGYLQQEIADMLGVSQSLVSRYSRM